MARYVRLRDTSFLRATATHAALISVVVSFIAVFASDESLPYSAQAGDVASLLPLQQLIRSSNSSLAGWSNDSLPDPCGSPNCTTSANVNHPENLQRCSFEGVSCQNGRITALKLECGTSGPCVNPIRGQLPSSLSNLSALQVLLFRNNALTGSLPSADGWASLLQLDLHGNFLEGKLPDTWGQKLQQLQSLDVGANMLSGSMPPSWCDMANMRQLDLSGNRLSGSVPSCFANMQALQVLAVNGNCPMCGGIPMLQARLYAHNTTLGSSCGLDGAGKCGGPYSYNSLMVAVAVLLGSFMLCLVQRHVCWRWRVTGLMMGWEAQNSPQPEDQAERGQADGRHKRIPSFEAYVELQAEDPSGRGRHAVQQQNQHSSTPADHPTKSDVNQDVCSMPPLAGTAPTPAAGLPASTTGLTCSASERGDSVSEVLLLRAIRQGALGGPDTELQTSLVTTATVTSTSPAGLPLAVQQEQGVAPSPRPPAAALTAADARAVEEPPSANPTLGQQHFWFPAHSAPGMRVPQPLYGSAGSSSSSFSSGSSLMRAADPWKRPMQPEELAVRPPAVVLMPDERHVALAILEIERASEQGSVAGDDGLEAGNSHCPAAAAAAAAATTAAALPADVHQAAQQQQQQHQRQRRRQQGQQPLVGAAQRAGRVLLEFVVYLFVQPVREDEVRPHAAGRRGSVS